MSEFQHRQPYPLPEERDYCAAAELTDMLFGENNGAWNYFHKTLLVDTQSDQNLKMVFEVMLSQARLIEPMREERLRPLDPLFKAAQAFRAGQWTGVVMTQFLYQDQLHYEAVHNSINKGLPYALYDSYEEHEENGRFMKLLGDQGLEVIGGDTRNYLYRWGEDIVSEPTVRRYYALGAGAVLFASEQIYSQIYDEMNLLYEAEKLNEEVKIYLSDFPDSSDI